MTPHLPTLGPFLNAPVIFSVVIPCYSQARFLGQALDSVLAQDYAHFEIIVVNDGSTDDTSGVVKKYQQAHAAPLRLIEQANAGQARARQRGLDDAHGDWLVMLDADDKLEPGALARGAAAIRRRRADALVGDARIVAEDGVTELGIYRQARPPKWPSVLRVNPIGSLAAAWAKVESVRKVGGLAVDGVPGSEDWDLWVRMTRAGMRFVPVNAILASYRQSGASYSRRLIPMLEAAINVLDRAGIDPRQYQIFRNARVFASLGTALGIGAKAEEFEQIMDKLVPGAIDPTDCADQMLGNLQAAMRGSGTQQLQPYGLAEQVKIKMERLNFDCADEVSLRMNQIIQNPTAPRSFKARLRDRF